MVEVYRYDCVMRPVLVVLALVLLILLSVAVGVLAADWPFWQRAWQWQVASPAWPARLPGAHAVLRPVTDVRELPRGVDATVSAAVSELLDAEGTEALLVARADELLFEYYGDSTDAATRLDGRELSALPVMLLYGAAALRGSGPPLDEGVAALLPDWQEDPRGQITPRQLLQGLSGLEAPRWEPLNPFGKAARLAAGPNFERAALRYRSAWPPGSHYAANPADSQLAAAVLARSTGLPVATLLRDWLAQPLGLDTLRVLLDRQRGAMAVHCCVQARARDWLTLALLVAEDGELAGQRIYPARFAQQVLGSSPVAPERALGVQRVRLAAGDTALLVRGHNRLLLADPHARAAWLWFGSRDLDDAALARLLRAVDATAPRGAAR
jgi:hypothetical protein